MNVLFKILVLILFLSFHKTSGSNQISRYTNLTFNDILSQIKPKISKLILATPINEDPTKIAVSNFTLHSYKGFEEIYILQFANRSQLASDKLLELEYSVYLKIKDKFVSIAFGYRKENSEEIFLKNRLESIFVRDSSFFPIFNLFLRTEIKVDVPSQINGSKVSVNEIEYLRIKHYLRKDDKIFSCYTAVDHFDFWNMRVNDFLKNYVDNDEIITMCNNWSELSSPCSNKIIKYFHPSYCNKN